MRCRADEQRLVFDRFSQSTILGLVSRPVSRVTHFVLCFFVYYYVYFGPGLWWGGVMGMARLVARKKMQSEPPLQMGHENALPRPIVIWLRFFPFPSNIKRNSAAEYIIILYWWRFRGFSTGLPGNAFRGVFGLIATVVGMAHEFLCKTRSKRI